MKRNWLIFLAVVVLVGLFAGLALAADSPLKIIVNGKEVKSDVPPQLVNGRTMVPIRSVAEALGAKVVWDEKTNSVRIDTSDTILLENRIRLLEEALAPLAPKEAAEKWAQGVKTRNGALQYAVLAPKLQNEKLKDYESCGWVTGVSSPWVENYQITKETKINDDTWQYEVEFNLLTSTGPAGLGIVGLTASHYGENWFISEIGEPNPVSQLKAEMADLLLQMYSTHYKVEKVDISLISSQLYDNKAEAEFLTTVTTVLGSETPQEWPPQKGRIQFLEENRDKLSPEKVKLAEEKIAFWNEELQEYIDNPTDSNMYYKVTAEIDENGVIKDDTVKFYYQDPMGKYLLFNKEDWPQFKTYEELVKEGYEEMQELVKD